MNLPSTGLTLILGGARSGKSAFAERMARETGRPVLFIATATALDEEMRERIEKHRAARPAEWQTLEAALQVGASVRRYAPSHEVFLLDCITLLVSNVLLSLPEETPFEVVLQHVQAEIEALLQVQKERGGLWLVVSNEVGLGVVPPYPLGRIYRDALGWANQRLAQEAARVLFMVAGIPLVVK
ncbi:MAG: bifunctional adenosylcobinamide kinase/adenosylcobinamide-phosphate guanylyltransferase [Anaerolineae bacterium]|nr:MAG: bifunctional adenosylcobinamide kinase/adenosylcobinamide-phosphate guanylyltransferase [Anaerolineae bacterium]